MKAPLKWLELFWYKWLDDCGLWGQELGINSADYPSGQQVKPWPYKYKSQRNPARPCRRKWSANWSFRYFQTIQFLIHLWNIFKPFALRIRKKMILMKLSFLSSILTFSGSGQQNSRAAALQERCFVAWETGPLSLPWDKWIYSHFKICLKVCIVNPSF